MDSDSEGEIVFSADEAAAEEVIDAWGSVLNKSWSVEKAFTSVGRSDLARIATRASCDRLVQALGDVEQFLGETGEYRGLCESLLAAIVLRHAIEVLDVDEAELSRVLFDACLPILKRSDDFFPHALRARAERVYALALLGESDEGFAEYSEIVGLCSQLSPGEEAELRNTLAMALVLMGRASLAVVEFEDALKAGDGHMTPEAYANTLRNWASAWVEIGDWHRAAIAAQRAGESARDLPAIEAECLVLIGRACAGLERYDDALSCFDCVIRVQESSTPSRLVATCRLHRAAILIRRLERIEEAPVSDSAIAEVIAEYETSLSLFKEWGTARDINNCRYCFALALSESGDHIRARELLAQVDPTRLKRLEQFRYRAGKGTSLWRAGEFGKALIELKESRAALERDVAVSGMDESSLEFLAGRLKYVSIEVRVALELSFFEDAYDAVRASKGLLLGSLRQHGDRISDSPGPDEIRRQLIAVIDSDSAPESTRLAALTQFTSARLRENAVRMRKHPIGPEARYEPATLDSIRGALPADWAIVDFWWVDENELVAFIITHDRLIVELELPLFSCETFQTVLQQFRAVFETSGNLSQDTRLDDLSHYFVEPLRPHLEGIKGLYLVPHGDLHGFPIHACRWREGGSEVYLGDRFEVAYLPSAAMLTQLPRPVWQGGTFSMANPSRGKPGTLPFSEWESHALGARLTGPGNQYYRGGDSTTGRLAGWSDASLVHFSCHGRAVSGFSPLSHLVLNDDLLLAHDITHRHPPLRDGALVILNGCQTGVRDRRAVDEGMGLMSAFLLRGAGAVLATQWCVNDCCAAEMAVAFVDAWVRGESPTKALQTAQRAARVMSLDSILQRCEDVCRHLAATDLLLEQARTRACAAFLCRRAGRPEQAREMTQKASDTLRNLGRKDEAAELMAASRASRDDDQIEEGYEFQRSRSWAAFHLVGRVT